MKNNDWSMQYQHPLWQKKRLEALNKAEWICIECGCEDNQLHVHHIRYVKGRKIWEYELDELIVLCSNCHEAAHDIKSSISELPVIARKFEISDGDILGLLVGYISAYGRDDLPEIDKACALSMPWGFAGGQLAAEALKLYDLPEMRQVTDLIRTKNIDRYENLIKKRKVCG